jgi:hypothetical protein
MSLLFNYLFIIEDLLLRALQFFKCMEPKPFVIERVKNEDLGYMWTLEQGTGIDDYEVLDGPVKFEK